MSDFAMLKPLAPRASRTKMGRQSRKFGKWRAEALVFSDEDGGGGGSFRKAWVTAVLRAHDVEVKWCADGGCRHLAPECEEAFRKIDLLWHDIRHEYASRLVERGVPLAQVRDLLGHASITTTER